MDAVTHSPPRPDSLAAAAELNMTDSSYLHGIDVSHYQGTINWASVAGSGISFAMCKATEGTTYQDPTFEANFEGIQEAGLYRGAYHFARPASNATAQADFFVETVSATGNAFNSRTMQLVLDLETDDGLGPSAVWSWVQTFVARIKVLTGRPCIIYTGYYFWNDNVGAPTDNLDCPLWIASYTSPDPVGTPTAWSEVGWAFWQYDDNGAATPGGAAASIPGISGNVDVDYFQNGGVYPSMDSLCY